ncbi:STAS domain-containing protein [Candidatus Desantisbacteria bacterium]|nr:STAS domain-containing protein [Candidatus Desantisbacteria bacterium]
MDMNVREAEDICILDIKGDIMADTKKELKEKFTSLIEGGKIKFIINFKDVYVIDSSGIGLLISTLQNVREKNGDIKILNISGFAKRTFNVTGLNNIFHIFTSEDKALESFTIGDNF